MVSGASFNHIMFIYMWTHIFIYFFFLMLAFTCVSLLSLTDNLYVVAGFDHLSQCLDSLSFKSAAETPSGLVSWLCLPLVQVFLILPVCKDAFIPLHSGSNTCERAAWRHSSIESWNSLGLCLKTQYIYFFLNSGFRIIGWDSPHPVPVCVP